MLPQRELALPHSHAEIVTSAEPAPFDHGALDQHAAALHAQPEPLLGRQPAYRETGPGDVDEELLVVPVSTPVVAPVDAPLVWPGLTPLDPSMAVGESSQAASASSAKHGVIRTRNCI